MTNSSEESSLTRRKALNIGMNTFIFLSPVGILMASYGQMFLKVSYLEKSQSKLSECFPVTDFVNWLPALHIVWASWGCAVWEQKVFRSGKGDTECILLSKAFGK